MSSKHPSLAGGYFKEARTRSSVGYLKSCGTFLAVPFTPPKNSKSKFNFVKDNFEKPAASEYSVCYRSLPPSSCCSLDKPLTKYSPNASRNRSELAPPPRVFSNCSQILRGEDHKKRFMTTAKEKFSGLPPEMRTNQAAINHSARFNRIRREK